MKSFSLTTKLRRNQSLFIASAARNLGTEKSFQKSNDTSSTDSSPTKDVLFSKVSPELEKFKSSANSSFSKFPWRHDVNLIPRLTPETSEYHDRRNKQAQIAYFFLQIPAWQILFYSPPWQYELADSCAYAFAKGVSAMLSRVYSSDNEHAYRNMDDLLSDRITVDFSYPVVSKHQTNNNDIGFLATDNNIVASREKQSKSLTLNDDLVNLMVDAPLRNLFQSAYENGKDQFDIRLETKPVNAGIVDVVAYPFVTRAGIAKNPELIELISNQNTIEDVSCYIDYIQEEYDFKDCLETTVEIQVLIKCNEVFQVRDRNTGEVVQGSLDGMKQNVYHTVRFERVIQTMLTETFPYIVSQGQENWKITDIDDLLGSKPWLPSKKNDKAIL